tara:strand:- start:143 stop:1036 length:894 start_codon:yes stop_codon:yes gene_type:complete
MKPTLLFNIGVPYAATTPLWFTLAHDNKICHTGHHKENHYLWIVGFEDPDIEVKNKFQSRPSTWNHQYYQRHLRLDPGEWTKEELDDFWNEDYNIDRYIRYYKRLSEKVDYPMVADFSNRNMKLKRPFLNSIGDKLKEHFNIKVTMIVRDPIRRWWSHVQDRQSGFESAAKGFEQGYPVKQGSGVYKLPEYCHYIVKYDNWKSVFPDIHIVVMEEFFEGKVEKFEEFLGHKINKIHRNVYWPELGTDAPKHEDLVDQWTDKLPLTPELVDIGKKKCYGIYKAFHERIGYIPEAWHDV